MMTTEVETIRNILIQARNLVQDGWTQGASARSSLGDNLGEVSMFSPSARRFCATGALGRAVAEEGEDAAAHLAAEAIICGSLDNKSSVIEWNDTPGRTQADVVALFNKAINQVSTTMEMQSSWTS